MIEIKFTGTAPERQHEGDSGWDLSLAEDLILPPHECGKFRTGTSIQLPPGYEAQVRPRSSLPKLGLLVPNGPDTIDSGYRGEIGVWLYNMTSSRVHVLAGTRVAQLVIAHVVRVKFTEVDYLESSPRGTNGFGSTGL